jgi:SAM-dependent methyltransferase
MARPRYGFDAPPFLIGLTIAARRSVALGRPVGQRRSGDAGQRGGGRRLRPGLARHRDMTALSYPDESFDLVVSNLAIHNIHPAPGRLRALDEALRVLRPGGRLVIADINVAPDYRAHLVGRGLSTTLRPLGWRMWYGGPWVATTLVATSKP